MIGKKKSQFYVQNFCLSETKRYKFVCILPFQRSAQVTRAMGSMMEDLSNATYGAYKTYTNSQTSESVLLFVCSVAR